MKFLTFAFVINFILVCWPKLDIIDVSRYIDHRTIISLARTCKHKIMSYKLLVKQQFFIL